MMDIEPFTPEAAAPEERYPFWGYGDLFLFVGMAFPSLLLGAFFVRAAVALLRVPVHNRIFELLPAQFAGYGVMFLMLWMLFRFQYGQPFWRSLRWVPAGIAGPRLALTGVSLAVSVALASLLLRTPDIDSPMKQLLSSPTSVVLLAVFGTTLGPLCEELVFRGFMQPLFVRSLGAVPGVLLAAIPFGFLHLQQYGWSWRHGLLITVAGAGFGWMRHRTGSTRAAVVMHIAYNCTFFVALIAQQGRLPSAW